jgi:hypothetical protein
MTTKEAIEWFKRQFGNQIESVINDTPLEINLIAAIAFQETGYLWRKLIGVLDPAEILALCVGDTFDAPSRDAFPQTKADLLNYERGSEMFAIARAALESIARYDDTYARVARSYPNKFCHGFGIFQYDLQFFRRDPEFFLEKKWHDFDACISVLAKELKEAMQRQGWAAKASLTDTEKVYAAIAYNRGTADLSRGFKQGKESDGKYYGENIAEFLRIALSPSIDIVGGTHASPTTPAAPQPPIVETDHSVLEFGETGDEVKLLQALLQSQGYFAGAVLGHFQEKTRQAVIYFQQTHLGPDGRELEVDGVVGANTWWALYHPSGAAQKSNIPRGRLVS